MLSGSALIGDRFIKYTVVFAVSAYRDLGNSGAVSIIVRMRRSNRSFSYPILF
jgi:hypothetical protein